MTSCQNLNSSKSLTTVFLDDTYQFTGVAVSKTGRIFVNYPRWSDLHHYSLVEVVDGKPLPYPNLMMNSWNFGEDGRHQWVCVQAVYIDKEDVLDAITPAHQKMR